MSEILSNQNQTFGSTIGGHVGDSRVDSGQIMYQGHPYGSRSNTTHVIMQADGTPFKSSGRMPQKGDDRTYVDIHNLNPYAQVLYTYNSSHGYRDNSYLIFFPREEWYQERQKYSLRSVAAFRSVVDAMVQPVFEKPAMRQSDNPLFDMFIQNADNTGTSVQDMVETALTHARMLGVTFLVMDNFPDASEPSTLADVIKNRKCPYVYEKMPQEVYKWKCTSWGKLEWITFNERQDKIQDPDHTDKFIIRNYYRRFDYFKSEIYYEEQDKSKVGEFKEIIESESYHNLGYLPVYPIMDFVKSNNLTNFPTPILADLANMSFVLYNMESWILLLDVYCFPILTLPPQDGQQISLSANNAIEVSNDAKFAPAFISPPTNCLEVLLKSADRIEDKIYKAANQLGVSGSKVHSMASGVSKEWDFRASNSLLSKTASAAKRVEEWFAKTFADYTRTEVTYIVDYPSEFVEAYSNQRIEKIIELAKTPGIPESFSRELWKEAAKVFFDDDVPLALKIVSAIDRDLIKQINDSTAAIADPELPIEKAIGDNVDQLPKDDSTPVDDSSGPIIDPNVEATFKSLLEGMLPQLNKGKK